MAIRALNTDNALFKRAVDLEDMKRRLLQQSGQTAGAAGNVSASATAVNSTSGTPPATDMAAPVPAAAQPEIRVMGPQEYSTFAHLSPGFRSGMSDADKAAWGAIGAKYNAGDSSWASDTNRFREDANWGSYTDENGNINGWLYAANGVGDYAPVFGGKVGTTDYREGTVFYAPDGSAYSMGADGTLTRSGTVNRMKYGEYAGPRGVEGFDAMGWDPNNGRATAEQLALARDAAERNGGQAPTLPTGGSGGRTAYQNALEQGASPAGYGGSYARGSSEYTDRVTDPVTGGTTPTSGGTVNPYQAYLNQWDYEKAPEWEGSEYQQRRDDALSRAEDMRWNYDPETDPVWQAYQKQYRREGDRATRNAMGEYAARTGGVPSSYAVTAASQAGDYYASQLSDKLPQLYNDAYNRYLQEFQRQMGISDQYAGFDQTEYNRYRDRLGQYNTDRSFDYGRYRDAVGDARYADETAYNRNYRAQRDAIEDQRYDQQWAQQLREYADAQGWKAAEWQQYLREYGDQLSEKERQWAYQMARDAVSDERYADETAYQRALRADETAYDRSRDALGDQRYDTQWQQSLREYEDDQYKDALSIFRQMGVAGGRVAAILGIPEGTTLEQYYAQYGYNPGSGSRSGSGYTPSPAPEPQPSPQKELEDDRYTFSGQKHENGLKKTKDYDKTLKTLSDWKSSGKTNDQIYDEIERLIRNYTITQYEGLLILNALGYNTGTPGSGRNAHGIQDLAMENFEA